MQSNWRNRTRQNTTRQSYCSLVRHCQLSKTYLFVALGTDGTLDYYSTIFNAFLERHHVAGERDANQYFVRPRKDIPSLKLPFLALAIEGRTWVLSASRVEGVQRPAHVRYWGHYPVADIEYELDAPVHVGLRAWAPFFPGDADSSNTPGAVFLVHLWNEGGTPQQGTLAFSIRGPRIEELVFNAHGLGQAMARQEAQFDRRDVDGDFRGVAVTTTWEDMTYEYALGVASDHHVRTGAAIGPDEWADIDHSLPSAGPIEPGASVAVDFDLAPGSCQTVCFVLTWYAPRWRARGRYDMTNPMGTNDYVHKYASRFAGAVEVARHLSRHHDSMLGRILGWQEVIYSQPALPDWLQDSLINVFAVVAQQSFWATSTDSDHWWGPDGLFCVNESVVSCPQQACMANDNIGQWPVDLFFPDQARAKLRAFKHFQRSSGQTPSTLGTGTEMDQPWYDQQLTIDSQVYVHMVDRLWQITGDRRVLDEFYSSVKAATQFLMTIDQDGDGLLDVKGMNQYYDQWKAMAGAAVHVAGFWLATLAIAARMAEGMGDEFFVQACQKIAEKGRETIEQSLWNERAGSYLLYHQPTTGIKSDSVLSDQLIGQWYAHLHGLSTIFPEHRVKTVLETIWSINVASTPFGVRVAMRPDGSSDTKAFFSTCLHPSYSSLIPAMVCIYEVDRDRGEQLMRRVWTHVVFDLGMPWDMPGGLAAC